MAGADDPQLAWHQQQSSDLSRVALMGGVSSRSMGMNGAGAGPEVRRNARPEYMYVNTPFLLFEGRGHPELSFALLSLWGVALEFRRQFFFFWAPRGRHSFRRHILHPWTSVVTHDDRGMLSSNPHLCVLIPIHVTPPPPRTSKYVSRTPIPA